MARLSTKALAQGSPILSATPSRPYNRTPHSDPPPGTSRPAALTLR